MSNRMHRFFAALLLAAALLPSCKKQEKALSSALNTVSQVAELGTVEYTFTKLYAADGNAWYEYGTRKALYEAEAHVKAGIKMNGFDQSRVQIDGQTGEVTVVLPHAELLSFHMPPEKIHPVYTHVDGLRDNFSAEEQLKFSQQAEKAMRAYVDSTDIFKEAERNAEMYFKSMFSHLGYEPESVTVTFE